MAWGFLDRFLRPKWLLDRILLVAEHVAEHESAALPALLIDTLQEHLGAQHACIHFVDPGMLRPETREAVLAGCPATIAKAAGVSETGIKESLLWQLALSSRQIVIASTTPAAVREELRPLLNAVGARDGMAIPLIYQGAVYAVVNLYFKRTVPSKLATAENVLRSIRLLGNLVYSVLLQEYQAGKLQESDRLALALAQAVAARDGYADGHVASVCRLAQGLGVAAGLSRVELDALRLGAMLRDVGKLHVPDYILQKPGALDAEERAAVHEHPLTGEHILLARSNKTGAPPGETLRMAAAAVRSHHERLDGSGYPDSLVGSAIPVLARIVAIVDVYAALTADRPYRAALSAPRAAHVLQEMAGSALDPELVSLFLSRDNPAAVSSEPSEQAAPATTSSTVA